MCCSCSASTRSRSPSGGFVVYIGTHGDRGAHRADVVLPGAAYPEKSAIYVNTEGRVQMTNRAAFPPGDAREDWAILRALSEALGHKLPFDSLDALRQAMFAAHPHLMRIDQIEPGDAKDIDKLAKLGGNIDKAAFASAVSDFYLTNPITRASAIMAECSALAHAAAQDRGGVGRMMDFFWTYLWPLIIIVVESVVLLVVLLVAVAYVLLADRKIWAAVQIRRGPNVVGPWGLFQSFADLLKFVVKEPVIPAGANKGVFLLAPLDLVRAGSGGLGRDPGQREMGDRQYQCRRALHFRDLVADGLRRHHGGLGVEFEISRFSPRCARRRRWCPTKSPSAS